MKITLEFEEGDLLTELELEYLTTSLSQIIKLKEDGHLDLTAVLKEMSANSQEMELLRKRDLNTYNKVLDDIVTMHRSRVESKFALYKKILEKLEKYKEIVGR
jgi:hypothetical protein